MKHSQRILLIDDNQTMLLALQRLHRKRFDIDIAIDSDSALRLVDRVGPYAVVVSDWHMPGMDGPTLLAEVRKRQPQTTLMLLTGGGYLDAADHLLSNGCVDRVLIKPCSRDVLAAELQHGIDLYLRRAGAPA